MLEGYGRLVSHLEEERKDRLQVTFNSFNKILIESIIASFISN